MNSTFANNTTAAHLHCPNHAHNFTMASQRHGGYEGMYKEFTISTSLLRIATPLWIALGIPGTLLSFIVWTRKSMRQSSSIYLATLAAVDFLFFICQIPWFLTTVHQIPVLVYPGVCELFPVVNFFLQYMSPLLTMGFSVERYVCICHPFWAEQWCSTGRARRIVLGLALTSLAIASLQGYFFQYHPGDQTAREAASCIERPEVVDPQNWQNSFLVYWNYITELLIFGLVPVTILLLNSLVIRVMRLISQSGIVALGQKKTETPQASVRASGTANSATTVMLLCVSFYFIFATLPVTVCQILIHKFWNGNECMTDAEIAKDESWQRHFRFTNVRAIFDTLAFSHYAAKFYIYMATGRLFRRQVFLLLTRMAGRNSHSSIGRMRKSARGNSLDDWQKQKKITVL